ncbi:MAG: TrkH family potassium uptake protein [Clostridia bacterium]|nr:TrkH family potassium uptake protein [Clostridia bacterium]
MNRRMVIYMVGQMIKIEALLFALPAAVSALYGEKCLWTFLLCAGIALVVGFAFTLLFKPWNKIIFAKEGFIIVALSWVLMSVVGALPFVISGEIPSFVDAFFETVSGFTTTGASILNDVEALSRGIAFWRSFTHWVGGMGVLVFVMAIIPTVSDRSIHILRAEMPGPIIGKLVPRAKKTAKILYLIYIALTVAEILFLLCGGMPLYDSLIHTFGTAGTGGFGIKANSIAGYTPYLQWVITIFMVVFGLNFNLFYLALIRHFRNVFKSGEMWCYLGIILTSIGIVTANIYSMYSGFSEALRHSSFQVASIITTTGFSTCDFNAWPELSKAILFLLMFIGACAGSTGGGLKVSRVIILAKTIKRDLHRMLHPRSVGTVRFEGKRLDESTINSVTSYFAIYVALYTLAFIFLCFDPIKYGIETNATATAACFNNIGPGLGFVGPASSYSNYSDLSKIVLSVAMLLGRLEIYPIVFLVSPSTWTKR